MSEPVRTPTTISASSCRRRRRARASCVVVVLALRRRRRVRVRLPAAHARRTAPRRSRRPTSGAMRVEVVTPKVLSSDRALALPGVVQAARGERRSTRAATGYVREWLVDIGDKVKEGQLLAEIDTPELDAQLAQARAQLAPAQAAVKQAIAQRDYAKSNVDALRDARRSEARLEGAGRADSRRRRATDEATVAAARVERRRAGGERPPPARAARLREGHRAVRRHDHGAHDRARRARRRRRRDADVHARRDRSGARLRRRAAERRAERHAPAPTATVTRARVRRPRVRGQGHALRRARSIPSSTR